MSKFQSLNEVLDFAMNAEQRAIDFYNELAEKSEGSIKQAFVDFAKEEQGHKSKLKRFKETGIATITDEAVMDLKISDYVVDVEAKPEMTFQEVLILAMKREKAAFKLYTNLAAQATDYEVKKLFSALAQEEAKHKLRFEIEYDDRVLAEN